METLRSEQLPSVIDFERYDKKPAKLVAIDSDSMSDEEIENIARICNQRGVKEYVTFQYATGLDGRYTLEDAKNFVETLTKDRREEKAISYLIFANGQNIIGNIGLKDINSPEPEIGYWSDAESPNARGYMTDAAKALCEQAAIAGYSTIRGRVAPSNQASIQVLERAGFSQVGTGNDETGKFSELLIFRKKLA